MAEQQVPAAGYAIIGGSGTLSSDFPRASMADDVEILADGLHFATPYGESPAFRLFSFNHTFFFGTYISDKVTTDNPLPLLTKLTIPCYFIYEGLL